ncbi:diacylglycerol/lipid kinase family protein [Salimicrobium salexigens]|uniref:Lipid kinase, YegS/Rv2252/BmrU family n=1 Tax=Salimicrobium salexigens TaxID=908941 RepID=A0ABY1KVW1_9BACI|nr:YegS/Rv2252/BmrU family lipid kinase [Salimicrobium salexigens]SIS84673.1 lipid kinase, YegS/Rv2252/BmrU family [Salimicrobium salexigens]
MASFDRGLLVYQANAGQAEIEHNLSQVLPVLAEAVKELSTVQTESIEDLHETAKRYKDEIDVFFILGGDGTVHECVNIFAEEENPPRFGVLPAGTCNDFARMLGIPMDLNQAARTIVNGETKAVDIGKADGRYFANFWGIGLVTRTSYNIDEEQKDSLGVLSYFISAFKTMSGAETFEYQLEIDGRKTEGEAVMLMVMNGAFIGTRQVPDPEVKLDDGYFNVMVIKDSNFRLFRELMTMNRPWTKEENFRELEYKKASHIKVTTDPVEEVDRDGEIEGETPSEITLLPKHLSFLTGESGTHVAFEE